MTERQRVASSTERKLSFDEYVLKVKDQLKTSRGHNTKQSDVAPFCEKANKQVCRHRRSASNIESQPQHEKKRRGSLQITSSSKARSYTGQNTGSHLIVVLGYPGVGKTGMV